MAPRGDQYQATFTIPLCNKIIQILVLCLSLFVDTQTCSKSVAEHASTTSASTYKTSQHQNPGVYYHRCEIIQHIKKEIFNSDHPCHHNFCDSKRNRSDRMTKNA
jgi:hypothetical protein